MPDTNHGFTKWVVLLLVLLGVAAAAAGWAWYQGSESEEAAAVNSFEACVAAGHPVMESYPRQCSVPGGQSFTEDIEAEEPAEEMQPPGEYESEGGVQLSLDSPSDLSNLSSPVTVSGEVPGTWAFEGNFPVELRDQDGEMIASAPGALQGDWMSQDHLPFEAELEFTGVEPGSQGSLLLIKDNPSNKPELDDRLELPVEFVD